MVRRAPGRGRRRDQRSDRHQRAAPNRYDRAGGHALSRPAIPVPTRLGAGQAGAATRRRRGSRRSTSPGVHPQARGEVGRRRRHAHLRGRRDDGGHRDPRNGLSRPTDDPSGRGLPKVVAQCGFDRHLQIPPARREVARVPTATGAVAVQGPASQVPSGGVVAGLSRDAVRDDAPRPRQGRPVVHQFGVDDLSARSARAGSARSGPRGQRASSRGNAARHRGTGAHRRGPLPRRPPP